MRFVIRILFHLLVVLDAFKHHLTEAIEVGDIRHLTIVDFVHQHAGLSRVVNLERALVFIVL